MDEYEEFASDDFDVKAWINSTVATHQQLLRASEGAEGDSVSPGTPSALSSSAVTG